MVRGPEVLLEELPYPCPWLCGVTWEWNAPSSPNFLFAVWASILESGLAAISLAIPFRIFVHGASAELELDNDNIFRCMVRRTA